MCYYVAGMLKWLSKIYFCYILHKIMHINFVCVLFPITATPNSIIVKRLYSSSLVAVVSGNHPRKLTVNHFKKNSHICSYTYVQSILNVLLNREVSKFRIFLQLFFVVAWWFMIAVLFDCLIACTNYLNTFITFLLFAVLQCLVISSALFFQCTSYSLF